MIVPEMSPSPVWWPFFKSHVIDSKVLCKKGDKHAVLFPTRKGFQPREKGLNWTLIIARLCFKSDK
jgi:hypothetical protein